MSVVLSSIHASSAMPGQLSNYSDLLNSETGMQSCPVYST